MFIGPLSSASTGIESVERSFNDSWMRATKWNRIQLAQLNSVADDAGMKDDSFSPRSRTLSHVMIMHTINTAPMLNRQVPSQPAIRQFTGSEDVRTPLLLSRAAKACEYPARRGVTSHPTAILVLSLKQDYLARIPASRWKRVITRGKATASSQCGVGDFIF